MNFCLASFVHVFFLTGNKTSLRKLAVFENVRWKIYSPQSLPSYESDRYAAIDLFTDTTAILN